MPEPALRTQQGAPADPRPPEPLTTQQLLTRAVGTLMASTPCTARDARLILAAAADLARVTDVDVAVAMATAPGGVPAPRRVARALRRAVEAARTPSAPAAPTAPRIGLLPSRARTEEVLSRLRACRARLANAPDDADALRAMDDAAYTLCVLMGRPRTHEAVLAAERHLAGAT